MNPLHTLPDNRDAARATTSCSWFDLLDPDPAAVRLDDIAVALQRLRRWTGHSAHTSSPPNVLDHSLHVHQVALSLSYDRRVHALAVLHDAHEAYVGDVSTPAKHAMRQLWRSTLLHPGLGVGADPVAVAAMADPWEQLERRVERAVWEHFRLDPTDHELDLVKMADRMVCGWEADHLFGPGTAEVWGLPTDCPEPFRSSPRSALMRFKSVVITYTGIDS